MKISTILAITLCVFLGSIWVMYKIGSGRGNHIWHNDFNKPRIEWVMTALEEEEKDIPDLFELLEEEDAKEQDGDA